MRHYEGDMRPPRERGAERPDVAALRRKRQKADPSACPECGAAQNRSQRVLGGGEVCMECGFERI